MRISSIELTKFLCHQGPVTFDIGPNVTLIAGINGSGKSALLEGIVWAIWGHLPARPARIDGTKALLKCGSQFQIDRSFNGKTEIVDIGSGPGGKRRSEEAIEALFGNYPAWERSLYVTGENVSAFSTGSQTLRWDHLEKVTGANRFKDLYKFGQNSCRESSKELEKLGSAYDTAQIRLEYAKEELQRKYEVRRFLNVDLDAQKLQAELRDFESRLCDVQNESEFLTATLETFDAEVRELRQARKSLEEAVEKVVYRLCETCGSRVPTEKNKTDLRERLALVKDECNKAQEVRSEIVSELDALKERSWKLSKEILDLRSTVRDLEQRESDLATEEMFSAGLLERLLKHQMDVDRIFTEVELKKKDQKLFGDVVAALGPSGAPRRYIRQYLARITQYANHYLETMSSSIRIRLTAGEDGKTLGIETSGIPATCYEHASGGQRRRIDLCLLLAMAEAAAEVGTIPKDAPLVFDEALDTLDAEGVESLIFLACDIATRRQVLLVSHADPSLPLGSEVHRIHLGSNSWTRSMSV